MMRKYSDKKNAQTQNYYKDRFYSVWRMIKSIFV
ncbi:NADH-quinone oxidoreductase subunit C, partial [Campylobacter jejuni]